MTGECEKNKNYMEENCKFTCKACVNSLSQKQFAHPASPAPDPRVYLREVEAKLKGTTSGTVAAKDPDAAAAAKASPVVMKDPDSNKVVKDPDSNKVGDT